MTINKKLLVCAITCLLSTPGFASSDSDAINAAEKAQQAAASVGYEWRDTGKMIKQAKELSQQGKSADAIKLAKLAEEQAKDAYAQYQHEASRYTKSH